MKINVLERILRRREDFSGVFGGDERSRRVFSIILWRSSSFERSKIFSDDRMSIFSERFLKISDSNWNVSSNVLVDFSLDVPLNVPLTFSLESR